MHVWQQTVAVIETNTWCSLVREECPSLCSGGWFGCLRWKKQKPKAFSPINHWYLTRHLRPGTRAGWVNQSSSGSYLIWCPQHVICAKAARKFEGKKSLFFNCSTLFYLCITYCNLVWCKNTLVKAIYSEALWLYPKFSHGNWFYMSQLAHSGYMWDNKHASHEKHKGQKNEPQDLLLFTDLYIILWSILLFLFWKRVLVNIVRGVHSEYGRNTYILSTR